jgi:hypothetical protein
VNSLLAICRYPEVTKRPLLLPTQHTQNISTCPHLKAGAANPHVVVLWGGASELLKLEYDFDDHDRADRHES